MRRLIPLTLAALALSACGGSDSTDGEPTPEEVRENLIDAGYGPGEVLKQGAPEDVVDGEDAIAYVSVDSAPDGGVIYASIYFLPDEELAKRLHRGFEENGSVTTATEIRGTRVYNIAGDEETLSEVVEAAEG